MTVPPPTWGRLGGGGRVVTNDESKAKLMKNLQNQPSAEPGSLVWVIPHSLNDTLYATARFEPARELQKLGWQVTLVAAGPRRQETMLGFTVQYFPMPDVYFLRQLLFHLAVIRYLLKRWAQLDVIFFQQISGMWLLPLRFWRLFRRSNRPLIVMDTRDLMDLTQGDWKARLRMRFYALVYQWAHRLADGQTAITERMAQLVKIAPAQLWGIWPSGVNLERFTQARPVRQWPTGDTPIQLIYIGMLLPKRNLHLLCQALRRAAAEDMNFLLTLLGEGSEQEALGALAAASNGQIRILPPVPHEQVPMMLAQAHVGVTSLPAANETKYQASSPIKLFEYMASGLPLLSTSNACHTDVIGDAPYAFWAADADEEALLAALRRLWAQRNQLPCLGDAAAQAADGWTWRAASKKLSDALLLGLTRATPRTGMTNPIEQPSSVHKYSG